MIDFDFSTTLREQKFKNPIFTASGCAGYGRELAQFFELPEIGALVTKSIAIRTRSGRPTPRMAQTPAGMINSIGLQGPGIDEFLKEDLPWLEKSGVDIVVSIAGDTRDEFATLARRLRPYKSIKALEINISCPNVENRGLVFACDRESAASVVASVRENIAGEIPIFAKLTPDVTSIADIAVAVANAGADGVAMINTTLGMVIDLNSMRPMLSQKTGGLSGPAIHPIAVRAIYQVHERLPKLPIIGMGGVRTGGDALALILAGASAVSVGTALFANPLAAIEIRNELKDLLIERKFKSVAEAVGYAHRS
jgi:dihydroorotate dehydrogenase (NAD+) catalytic subunit